MDNLHERIRKLEEENKELRQFKESVGTKSEINQPNLESYIQEIADQIPGHLACVDAKTLNYLYVNKAFQNSFSIPQHKIIGSHIKDIIGEKNYQFALKYISRVRKGETISYENTFELNSGRRWVKVNYAPSMNEQGDVVSILVLSYDITEKKEAEIALTISEEKYRLLIEESSDPLFSLTPEGRYTYVNKAFARGLQKEQESIIGKTMWAVFGKAEGDKRFTILKKAFDTGEIQTIEVCVPRPDGDLFFITTVTPIKDDQGNINSSICISKDITMRKRAEIELKKSEAFLSIANATKDKFFSILAHDLKNPFNALIGLSELLYENAEINDSDEVIRFSKAIHDSSTQAHKLLENLLEWSRTQTGTIQFNPEKIQLNTLIEDISSLYQNAIDSKKLTFNNAIEISAEINADSYMMNTILRNLIMNAIKFTPIKGIITIGIEESDKQVKISVSDTGMGISPEKLTRLFSISERVVSVDTEAKKGTGLGLILCKEFVEKHGGQIWAESTIGKGSTFHVSLPKVYLSTH